MRLMVFRWLLLCSIFLLQSCGGGDQADGHTSTREAALAPMTSSDPGVATFTNTRANYRITKGASSYTVVPITGSEYTRALTSVHTLVFSDMTINLGVGDLSTTIPAASLNTIIELYIAFFNRLPDADGLSFWITQFRGGTSIDRIADSFYTAAVLYSPLTGYSATMTNADFVRVVYKNVLGRDTVDAQALEYWSNRLATGTPRGTLVTTILESAHTFKNNPSYGWVADLLDNKLSVGHYFSVQQGVTYRSPEESITRTMNIASAVTPTDTFAATNMISRDAGFNLLPIGAVTNDNGLTFAPFPLTAELPAGYTGQVSVRATINRDFPGNNYVAIVDNKGVLTGAFNFYVLSETMFELSMSTASNLAPGMHEGYLEIRVCLDDPLVCTRPQPGSPWKVPYRFIVTNDVSVATTALSGTATEATTFNFPSRPIVLATGQSGPDYAVTYGFGQAAGWLSASASQGLLNLKANTAGLAPGQYSATLRINGLYGSPRDIPVQITVTSGFKVPANLALQITNSTASTTSGYTINGNVDAVLPVNWTATSNQAWLKVDTAAGTSGTGNNLRVHVDPALAEAFPNNSTQHATLTLADPTGKLSPVTIPVDVTVSLPEFTGTAPFHLIRGEAETVTLRGNNLDKLALANLTMGGLAVTNAMLVNARTVQFQPPANLAVGTYPISAAGRIAGSVSMPVINYSGTHAQRFMATASTNEPDQARRLVFDDGRDTLYVSNYSGVARYKHASGTWTRTWLSIPDAVYAMALSPDRNFLAVAARSSLYLVNVSTFTVAHTVAYSTAPNAYPGSFMYAEGRTTMAFAPNGRLQLSEMPDAFDMASKKFVANDIGFQGGALSQNIFGNQLLVNADPSNSTVYHNLQRMRASDLELARITPLYECNEYTMATSRRGTVTGCGYRFYSDAGGLLGTITYDYYEGNASLLMSPDGSTAYAVHPYGSVINAYQFADGFRKVKTFKNANLYQGGWDYGLYGDLNDLTISQDGQTIFIANAKGLLIIPVSAFSAAN
jgi:hypothetical protein